jgi:hypothetical protein
MALSTSSPAACSAMAYQEGKRAREMENPTARGPIENTAKRLGGAGGEVRVRAYKAAEMISGALVWPGRFA